MGKEITMLSAVELARQIRQKELLITDVVSSFLDVIESKNPLVNAISDLRPRHVLMSEARQMQAQLENGHKLGPLFGVPITIKESIMVRGMKLTNGDPLLRKNIADDDALIVKKLKDAGAIIIGMTNIAFFSIDWQSANFWNGTTNNPHDLSRTPGGSSGGSAAAVAAKFSPISLGSDAGGSIRVPAHFCGIYGLRPTENYVSNRGHLKMPGKPQGRRHVVTPGPFANHLEDITLTMQVLTDSSKYAASEIPNVDFESSTWDKKPLNIAYSDSINGVEIDDEYRNIFLGFINALKSSVHSLTIDHPQYDEKEAYMVYGKISGFENGINMPGIPFLNWFFYLFLLIKYRDHAWAYGMAKGTGMSNATYAKQIDYKDNFSDVFHSFLSRYDVWITPVCAMEAFKHQKAGKPILINGKRVPYTKTMASFNFTSAMSGHPILVIPVGKMKNGLPVGVQIHAKKWNEKRLIEIAAELEKVFRGA